MTYIDECPDCHGDGGYYDGPEWVECPLCVGIGEIEVDE